MAPLVVIDLIEMFRIISICVQNKATL